MQISKRFELYYKLTKINLKKSCTSYLIRMLYYHPHFYRLGIKIKVVTILNLTLLQHPRINESKMKATKYNYLLTS